MLLPALVDSIARSAPQRSWAEMPIDDTDISKGYQFVAFKLLAETVNWLRVNLPGMTGKVEGRAYINNY